jgi:hypothetical protein
MVSEYLTKVKNSAQMRDSIHYKIMSKIARPLADDFFELSYKQTASKPALRPRLAIIEG